MGLHLHLLQVPTCDSLGSGYICMYDGSDVDNILDGMHRHKDSRRETYLDGIVTQGRILLDGFFDVGGFWDFEER
jgi:hypothetical protein